MYHHLGQIHHAAHFASQIRDALFFLTIGHPTSSTTFPYTTLFRSLGHEVRPVRSKRLARHRAEVERLVRSEEHTSELQSHSDLVCRLLLGKKKSWIGTR